MTTVSTSGSPADGKDAAYRSYFSARHFNRQGRVILFALAREIYENFSPEEAHGFFRQIGARIAEEEVAIPAVETMEELEAAFNVALAGLNWGYLVMTLEDGAMVLRQYAFPGHLMDGSGAQAWRRAFAALLTGVYTTWLREQGGGPALDVKVRDDTAPDVLELAYGL